jgi:hypothetical protein
MSEMLDPLNDTESLELTEGNVKLKIALSDRDGEVLWMYTENGVDFSPKSLSLVFEDGILKQATDGWFLFRAGSTEVNVSSEEAILIARNHLRDYSWTADGQVVSGFTVLQEPVSAVFHPTPRDDPLDLIPYWGVTLYLDKDYPGGVNRIAVGLWADTGEISQVRPLSG